MRGVRLDDLVENFSNTKLLLVKIGLGSYKVSHVCLTAL